MTLLEALNVLCCAPPVRWLLPAPAVEDRRGPAATLAARLPTSASHLARLLGGHDLRGRALLDVGCGLGDHAVAAVAAGAARVVGLDLDPGKLSLSGRLAAEHGAPAARFAVGTAARLPFPDGVFDVVLLLEVLEHVDDPASTLAECARVLRSGGRLVVTFPPYRSPWGGHLFAHLRVPWAHLLFAEQEVVELWRKLHRRELARGSTWTTAAIADRIASASTVAELWSLNGMTVRRFLELVERSSLEIVRLDLKTPAGLGAPLTASARLRELVVTRVGAIMKPRCASSGPFTGSGRSTASTPAS